MVIVYGDATDFASVSTPPTSKSFSQSVDVKLYRQHQIRKIEIQPNIPFYESGFIRK